MINSTLKGSGYSTDWFFVVDNGPLLPVHNHNHKVNQLTQRRDQGCTPERKVGDNGKDWRSGGSKFQSWMVRWEKVNLYKCLRLCSGTKVAGCLFELEGLARWPREIEL